MARPSFKLETNSVAEMGFQTKYPVMKFSDMTRFLSEAKMDGIAKTAFQPGGFVDAYEQIKVWHRMPYYLAMKREKVINCMIGWAKKHGGWRDNFGRAMPKLRCCYVWGFDPENEINNALISDET